MNTKWDEYKKTTIRHIIFKVLITIDKEKILKAAKEKEHIPYREATNNG